jgi:hypothetical protein
MSDKRLDYFVTSITIMAASMTMTVMTTQAIISSP